MSAPEHVWIIETKWENNIQFHYVGIDSETEARAKVAAVVEGTSGRAKWIRNPEHIQSGELRAAPANFNIDS